MADLYSVQEVCFGCKSLIGSTIQLYASSNSYYQLPSGLRLSKSSFEVPSWCDDCYDFRLSFHPKDIDAVAGHRNFAEIKYKDITKGIYFSLIGRFIHKTKLEVNRYKYIIENCDAIFEFALHRSNYNTPSCLHCGSRNVDTRWSDKENNFRDAKLATERTHECGAEIFYVITKGHYTPARGRKATIYDCADNILDQ